MWLLLALLGCTDPGQGRTLGTRGLGRGPGGGGGGRLQPLGLLAGGLGWQSGLRRPTSPFPSWPPYLPLPSCARRPALVCPHLPASPCALSTGW